MAKRTGIALAAFLAAAAAACAETVNVPAGGTVKAAGRVFEGDVLVKTGAGTLDLQGALVNTKKIEVKEGTVRFAVVGNAPVAARYLRWQISKTRPGKPGPPEYAGSGSQFSEFRLYRGGKMLPHVEGAVALNAINHREGPQYGYDGKLETKALNRQLVLDFGKEVVFDGYSYATGNDAIARDPLAWELQMGVADGSAINWVTIGSEDGFYAVKERRAEAGKVFKVSMRDVVPSTTELVVGGKGKVIFENATETLEKLEGTGAIELRNTTLMLGSDVGFAGTVYGDGTVSRNPKTY